MRYTSWIQVQPCYCYLALIRDLPPERGGGDVLFVACGPASDADALPAETIRLDPAAYPAILAAWAGGDPHIAARADDPDAAWEFCRQRRRDGDTLVMVTPGAFVGRIPAAELPAIRTSLERPSRT